MTTTPARRAVPLSALIAALVALTGCGGGGGGMSDYEKDELAKKNSAVGLKDGGVKLTEKDYPPHGKAYLVDMSNMSVTDAQLKELKKIGKISELHFQGSTITDAQLDLVRELGLGNTALKVDLSKTGVSDAGLDKLDNLMLLMELNLTGTKVTQTGVNQFKAKRTADTRVLAMFKNPRILR